VTEQIKDEIVNLIDLGVLRSNSVSEDNWFVNVNQDEQDPTQLNITMGFTPTPVTSSVKIDITVNTN
jgi:hypothetical protein